MRFGVLLRVVPLLAVCGLLSGTAAVAAHPHPVEVQADAQQSVAQRCFEHHKFGAEPVDVAKTADRQTVLAQTKWNWHDAIGCYLTLDDNALAALRAAPAPQTLPDTETEASTRCFEHHQFGQRPVDVAKTADRQTVLARLSWGYHDTIGCYLVLDDTALATLRAAAQPDPTPEPTPEPITEPPEGRYDPFYTQWVQAGPLDVIAPGVVDPAALRRVAATIEEMLANRPDIIEEMASHVYVIVAPSRMKQGELPEMAVAPQEWFDSWGQPDRLEHEVVGGFGPSFPGLPFVVVSADNALCTSLDSHPDEDVVVHELAHGIHGVQRQVNSSFDASVLRLYEDAIAAGLWQPSHYAATNHDEYFAEVFQSWADVNSRDDGFVHNPPIATAEEVVEHDPAVAAFMTEWFGHIELTSTCHRDPAARDEPAALP